MTTVNVIRYTLSFQEVFYDRVEGSIALEIRKLKLICTPDLPVGFLMNVKGVLETIISIEGISSGWDAYTGYEIEKNGAVIEKVDIISSTGNDPLLLSYVKNDQIFVNIEAHARDGSPSPGYYANSSIGMSINEAEMIIGQGNILGLPINYAAQAQVIST